MFAITPPTIPSSKVLWEKQKVASTMKQQLAKFEQSYIRPKPAIIPLKNQLQKQKIEVNLSNLYDTAIRDSSNKLEDKREASIQNQLKYNDVQLNAIT